MTIDIWGLKTCDTCRKAIRALPAARFRDVRAQPLDGDEIAALLAEFGEALVNRTSTTWRGLADADRATDPARLLAAYPALMKRPVIRADGAWHLGWSAQTRAALGVA